MYSGPVFKNEYLSSILSYNTQETAFSDFGLCLLRLFSTYIILLCLGMDVDNADLPLHKFP